MKPSNANQGALYPFICQEIRGCFRPWLKPSHRNCVWNVPSQLENVQEPEKRSERHISYKEIVPVLLVEVEKARPFMGRNMEYRKGTYFTT